MGRKYCLIPLLIALHIFPDVKVPSESTLIFMTKLKNTRLCHLELQIYYQILFTIASNQIAMIATEKHLRPNKNDRQLEKLLIVFLLRNSCCSLKETINIF